MPVTTFTATSPFASSSRRYTSRNSSVAAASVTTSARSRAAAPACLSFGSARTCSSIALSSRPRFTRAASSSCATFASIDSKYARSIAAPSSSISRPRSPRIVFASARLASLVMVVFVEVMSISSKQVHERGSAIDAVRQNRSGATNALLVLASSCNHGVLVAWPRPFHL